MSSVKATEIEGDVAVGRHVTTGGDAHINGHAVVEKNLKVKGWLDAPNIKGVCKGLFLTAAKLSEAYPEPEKGWWALVGKGVPAQVYVEDNGSWIGLTNPNGSPVLGGNPAVDAGGAIEELAERVSDIENNSLEDINHAIDALEESARQVLHFDGFVMAHGDAPDDGGIYFAHDIGLFVRGGGVIDSRYNWNDGDSWMPQGYNLFSYRGRLYKAASLSIVAIAPAPGMATVIETDGVMPGDFDLFGDADAEESFAEDVGAGKVYYSAQMNRFGKTVAASDDGPAHIDWLDYAVGTRVYDRSVGAAVSPYKVYTGSPAKPFVSDVSLGHVEQSLGEQNTRISGLQASVNSASNMAVTAIQSAGAAQSVAGAAQSNANTARTTADTAKTTANAAKTAAEAAQTAAAGATATAEAATEGLEQALAAIENKQDKLQDSNDITIADDKLSVTDKAKMQLLIDQWNEACTYENDFGNKSISGRYNEETGFFELNGLTDITYQQAIEIIRNNPTIFSRAASSIPAGAFAASKFRTTFPLIGFGNGLGATNLSSLFKYCIKVEVVVIEGGNISGLNGTFYDCQKLKVCKIHTSHNLNSITSIPFYRCYALETLELKLLNTSLDISSCSKISLYSLQYIIENRAYTTTAITITVSASVYAKLTGDTSNAAYNDLSDEEKEQWTALLETAAAKNIQFATV